jgi:proline dehydrogenase
VAGETFADAARTIRELNQEGAMATVDVLGEEVHDRQRASATVDQYLETLEALEQQGLQSNISLKLTGLGLTIDEGFCTENLRRVVARAAELGNFVRIDMENHNWTDATLRIFTALRGEFENVGVVLQAMLYRTADDVGSLPDQANIRLCKGIYREPPALAWQGYEEVRQAFVRRLDELLGRGCYVGIATHDTYLIDQALQLVKRYGLSREQYEFQMLLGVTPGRRRQLIEQGHRLRVYVPYGRDWYPYSIRRLQENPTVAWHVMRAFFRPG